MKFLINMQIQANRFKRWIELIPATFFMCAVITNYRQASDGRLKPCMLSHRLSSSRGLPNRIKRSKRVEKCCYLFQDLFQWSLKFRPMLSPFCLFNLIHYSEAMKAVQPKIVVFFFYCSKKENNVVLQTSQ